MRLSIQKVAGVYKYGWLRELQEQPVLMHEDETYTINIKREDTLKKLCCV